MIQKIYVIIVILLVANSPNSGASGGDAPGDTVVITSRHHGPSQPQQQQQQQQQQHKSQHNAQAAASTSNSIPVSGGGLSSSAGSGHLESRSSYAMLSEAMSQAVSHEFSSLGSGSADGSCSADDLECYSVQDRLGMEAIRSLHRQLDDDDNGNIDLSESDDFLREELKYEAGYEKRHKAFHYNDDMHISVKELWEAWLRSEVHNWTVEQTTDWLAQSVQLPQYVELFKNHKVTGAALPRLAVNNMHYVSNVLGIKDPIHKQKIALKAMDVVLFGPPRETGTRWKDYILVTLLLSAIIGCWYAYQQNKNAKRHLRRMAQDMEGLQRAEQALQEMQKELERARMEQENVATEKLDLERRLKEAPSLSSSSSDLELQQLKQEIEMLRSELSRAEVELVDHCWSPPPQLQSWLQYTYELENKNHLKKRVIAEKQLHTAREACEKLRKKRTSLVGAFVSTHGKSIDDVDRSIVEARNALSEVTNELQERLHRWKQVEMLLGFNIVNNNGFAYLENVLYNRNNGSIKSSRGRITNSTDDLDDESVQGMIENYGRGGTVGGGGNCMIGAPTGSVGAIRDDSSNSEDGGDNQSEAVTFFVGGAPALRIAQQQSISSSNSLGSMNSMPSTPQSPIIPNSLHNSHPAVVNTNDSVAHNLIDDSRQSPASSERSIPIPPRSKKPMLQALPTLPPPPPNMPMGRAPLPPPRRTNHLSHIARSQSTDTVPMDFTYSTYAITSNNFQSTTAIPNAPSASAAGFIGQYGGGNPFSYATSTASAAAITAPSFTSSGSGLLANSAQSSAAALGDNSNGNKYNFHAANSISTATTSPAIVTSTTHGDPKLEDTNSTDSSSLDDELKKRRRKLRFPFGKKSTSVDKQKIKLT